MNSSLNLSRVFRRVKDIAGVGFSLDNQGGVGNGESRYAFLTKLGQGLPVKTMTVFASRDQKLPGRRRWAGQQTLKRPLINLNLLGFRRASELARNR